jgi:RNA polymerase sigma-B factor
VSLAADVPEQAGEPGPDEIDRTDQTDETGPLAETPVTAGSPERPARPVGKQERENAALVQRVSESTDEVERRQLLDELVVLNLGVAHAIALRYRNRGIPLDDLDQVARLGLVKAAQGFDASRRTDFLAYAVPTIRGEVRRYFRDHGWTVRPPRRVQELQSRIVNAAAEMTHVQGRSPRPSELAQYLEVPVHDIEEALAADGCFSPSSLDRPVGGEDSAALGDLIPSDHEEHSAVDARVILAPAVRRLSERDRKILHLRFFNGWTQEEIAREIGVTQMHVSRLLTRILSELRTSVVDRAGVE